MRRRLAILALVLVVGVASSLTTAWIVSSSSARRYDQLEDVKVALASERQTLGVEWNYQLATLSAPEPAAGVPLGHGYSGVYLARILSASDTGTITVDWLGHAPMAEGVTNSYPTTQALVASPLSMVYVQEPPDESLSGSRWPTVPVPTPDVRGFFSAVASRSPDASEWLRSPWWVSVEGGKAWTGLVEASLPETSN